MCLNDPIMQAIYRDEISWADASEDNTPLEIDGWREYANQSRQLQNAWVKPPCIKRHLTPPNSPPKKKERIRSPKKIPVLSEEDKGKRTLFLGDIPKDVSNEDILKQIEPIAQVKRLHRVVDRCFAMITFHTPEDAQRVYLRKMNQFILKEKPRKFVFVTSEQQ